MLTPITPSAAAWDAFVRAHPRAHVLQLAAWAEHKTRFGWTYERVALADAGGAIRAGAQVLIRPLPGRLFTLAYIPHGGYVTDAAQWPALVDAVMRAARKHRAVFLKWEPGLFDNGSPPDLAALGFWPSGQTIQPPRTIVLDLTAGDDVILARMNQGTRRKIRQSQKAGVRTFEAAASDVPRFCDLMTATGARNGFGVHSAAYYQLAFDLFAPRDAALILAEHDGDLLAGVMVFAVDGAQGGPAWYLYGASNDLKRDMMASYAVQWAAIQWAKARGCATYDLWGVPDADEADLEAQFQTRSDGLWGVYGFKRGWGGRVVRTLGAWDRPLIRPLYWAFQQVLKLRKGAGE